MQAGDNVFLYNRFDVLYGHPSNVIIPTKPLVNEMRRAENEEARRLGITRKQYKKHLKKKLAKESE